MANPRVQCPSCRGRGWHPGYAFQGTENEQFTCGRCSGRGTVPAGEPARRARLRERRDELRRQANEIEHRLSGAL